MNKKLKLRAFAKANLSLNITGRDEKTGLHNLDSVMMSVDLFDTVTVAERSDGEINVCFTNADIGANNTAMKAARLMQAELGGGGWDIEIEKGIPVGAGLGGSSADGAAVLRALDLLYKLPTRGINMRKLALAVGSDVPFMLTGGLAEVTGTGGELFFIENKLQLFIVGLMGGGVATAQAYAEFDRLYPTGEYCPTNAVKLRDCLLGGETSALEYLGNALYVPAVNLQPDIAKNTELLKSHGAAVNMTGSGGMVLGYFTDMQKFAECARALSGAPGFVVFAPTRTGILHEWL